MISPRFTTGGGSCSYNPVHRLIPDNIADRLRGVKPIPMLPKVGELLLGRFPALALHVIGQSAPYIINQLLAFRQRAIETTQLTGATKRYLLLLHSSRRRSEVMSGAGTTCVSVPVYLHLRIVSVQIVYRRGRVSRGRSGTSSGTGTWFGRYMWTSPRSARWVTVRARKTQRACCNVRPGLKER